MDDFRQLELVTSGSMDGATQVLFFFLFLFCGGGLFPFSTWILYMGTC